MMPENARLDELVNNFENQKHQLFSYIRHLIWRLG
jgi:hypothetical protein